MIYVHCSHLCNNIMAALKLWHFHNRTQGDLYCALQEWYFDGKTAANIDHFQHLFYLST
jgi:hypothetical protein